ncbi:hypothetical protein [Lacticaseibacillus jixiensis]|uniref:hypothetical protein n=1 Tax=Lacticaseibacillus jixiensis TaxID=3231926 RepID=UPI0036F42B5A
MHYEIINRAAPDNADWAPMVARAKANAAQVIGLQNAQQFTKILAQAGLTGGTVVDLVAGRHYDPAGYRFFNDVPVPTGAKVNMYQDGSIYVEDAGDPIAREYLFPNTRRAVQDIRYVNDDGSLDFIQEFAPDGKHYSDIYYYNNDIQEIDFYNDADAAVVRYFFYNKVINYITIEDPQTHEVIAHYPTINTFLSAQIGQLVSAEDVVTIGYLGIELDVLAQTQSHNVLRMNESPFDEEGRVRGNLADILTNKVSYVHEVWVSLDEYEQLKQAGMPLTKLRVK